MPQMPRMPRSYRSDTLALGLIRLTPNLGAFGAFGAFPAKFCSYEENFTFEAKFVTFVKNSSLLLFSLMTAD